MRGGLACTVFCCSVDRWMYEVENVARRGVRRERARVRARETRVSVHCGVALVPVWCERPDRVSTRHGDRVSCVRCATGRTARGVVCSWSLESAPPLVVWVAWCGACGAQMAVWVSTALCISRYTDQTSGDREGESLALVSGLEHRASLFSLFHVSEAHVKLGGRCTRG